MGEFLDVIDVFPAARAALSLNSRASRPALSPLRLSVSAAADNGLSDEPVLPHVSPVLDPGVRLPHRGERIRVSRLRRPDPLPADLTPASTLLQPTISCQQKSTGAEEEVESSAFHGCCS